MTLRRTLEAIFRHSLRLISLIVLLPDVGMLAGVLLRFPKIGQEAIAT